MASNSKVTDIVYALALPLAQEAGCTLYEVEYKKEGAENVLRVVLDTLDNSSISIDMCEKVSRSLSDVLDEKDPIRGAYMLEVTSPGLDRPLKKAEDFKRFSGRLIDVGLYKPLGGKKTLCGTLKSYDDGVVTLECDGGEISVSTSDTAYIRLAVEF